ncbi:MAG: hypothetical protein IT337_17700 [Thermomicrobiales bacterium]|nr:hypothetical protein [Thermomicrobiales bacterium]
MSDRGPHLDGPDDLPPTTAHDIASAGRSCSAILVLAVIILLLLCIGIALRWALLQP